jgi:competence protein CoiA
MIPKCGRFRVAHWAHLSGDDIDHPWEPETEWHRGWKGYFPDEWHEVIHQDSNGERHFADVKTKHGQVIEFQHSPISEEQRSSREEFYRPMWWVVNGQRLKEDRPRFFEALRRGSIRSINPLALSVPVAKCMLLQKWADSRVPDFFDSGESEDASDMFHFGAPVLWASHPRRPKGRALVVPVYRENFMKAAINGGPIDGIDCSEAFERERQRRVLLVARRRPHHQKARPRWGKRYTRPRWRW